MDDDAQPRTASPAVTRRQLLAAGALAGTAAALAGCGATATVRPTLALATHVPSGDPATGPAPVPVASASPGPAATPLPPSLPPERDTAMRAENALPGNNHWDAGRAKRRVSAYIAAASVAPGDPLVVRANGKGVVDVEWYRLGWYDGAGGRLLSVNRGMRLVRQPARTFDSQTGLVEARWAPTLEAIAPYGVKSGMLLAVLRDASGHTVGSAPMVLRPDPTASHRAAVLFVSATLTSQAYNSWGGTDLYANTTGHPIPATKAARAARVSFDRPFSLDGGAGYLRRWELQFVRWMERAGRDVDYIADVDLERHPELVNDRKMIVMAGHPEYWSRPMRERLEAAIAAGANVAFLTANEVYWQVRIDDGPAGPATRVTCYKSRTMDPVTATNPSLTTCRWREAPVSEPEAPLVGEQYGSICRSVADWVVTGSNHWIYEGTDLRDGDAISNLVGQEYDSFVPELANPGTVILASGPVDANPRPSIDPGAPPSVPIHNATIYTAPSGATVFAAGTFQWSWALDDYGARSFRGVRTPVDDRVARMTRNLFDRLGDGPLAP